VYVNANVGSVSSAWTNVLRHEMGSGKYFVTATCSVTDGGNIVSTKHLLTDHLMTILDVFICALGPIKSVVTLLLSSLGAYAL